MPVLLRRIQLYRVRGKQSDELPIRLQEIVFRKRGNFGPLKSLEDKILQQGRISDVRPKKDQSKLHLKITVPMAGTKNFLADDGIDTEFLAQFALQRLCGSFAGLDF